MYKVKETEKTLKVSNKIAMGLLWTSLFVSVLLLSFYMSFEYIEINCKRETNNQLNEKSRCYINHFDFKNGLTIDSLLLSDIIRMDKGYSSSVEEKLDIAVNYNPVFITSQQERYPLRKISNIAFTPELLSKNFNDFIINKHPSLNTWDWYMGNWGITAGFSFLALLFLAVSGRYQVMKFDKEKYIFSIKNYGLFGMIEEGANWKDIKKVIYQDKETRHKKGIFFLVKIKSQKSSKKYKTKKIYFTHHTDEESKKVAQRIADLVRPIAKPNSEKNKLVTQEK